MVFLKGFFDGVLVNFLLAEHGMGTIFHLPESPTIVTGLGNMPV